MLSDFWKSKSQVLTIENTFYNMTPSNMGVSKMQQKNCYRICVEEQGVIIDTLIREGLSQEEVERDFKHLMIPYGYDISLWLYLPGQLLAFHGTLTPGGWLLIERRYGLTESA